MNIFNLWYDNIRDYSVLRFIITESDSKSSDRLKRLQSVVNILVKEANANVKEANAQAQVLNKRPMGFPPPGTDVTIYRELITGKPQPVPELIKHRANHLQINDCWIDWACIYDRSLTNDQRKILSCYREAFIVFLMNGDKDRANGVLKLAEYPFTYNLITNELLYSKDVLRSIMNL